jgi:hypothetical protein
MENGDRSNYGMKSILGHADIIKFVKSRRISWLGNVQCMDDHCVPKKILTEEIYGRKKQEQLRKCWVTCGAGPQEDECMRLVSEDQRLTGLEEDCAGGQGPYWAVVVVIIIIIIMSHVTGLFFLIILLLNQW